MIPLKFNPDYLHSHQYCVGLGVDVAEITKRFGFKYSHEVNVFGFADEDGTEFKYSHEVNVFGFADEDGTEFWLKCATHLQSSKPSKFVYRPASDWQSWVEIFDHTSEPELKISQFIDWLLDQKLASSLFHKS